MKKERIEQLKANLRGLGTKADKLYTNQEIIDLLKDLQGALAKGVFEKTHAENLRDQDIVIHFEALAREYGLDNSDTYLRFKENMGELGYTIGSFIKGMSGERIARRALKLLSYEKGVHILYNVQLEDEDVQAEYDAIVVAPYGMFVVEVKNWGLAMTISPNGLLTRDDNSGIVYDLPGRMSVKEALLREHLKKLFPEHYQSILLLSSEKAKVQDYYQKITISCGGGISYEIKAFEKAGKVMWKAADDDFPFNDSHNKTYNVRDGSDWEKTLKPRLHERLDDSKNIILFLSSITVNSRALREEVDYGINTKGLPVIVIYPDYSEKSDIVDSNGNFKKQIKDLWDTLPKFRDSKSSVAVLHVPCKKIHITSALKDTGFMVNTMKDAGDYYYKP